MRNVVPLSVLASCRSDVWNELCSTFKVPLYIYMYVYIYIKATTNLKNGKAAGVDGIPPDIWKNGRPPLLKNVHEPFIYRYEQSELTQDLSDAVIFTLCKRNGENSDHSNYQGITLLSVTSKICSWLLLNTLVPSITEANFTESLYVF